MSSYVFIPILEPEPEFTMLEKKRDLILLKFLTVNLNYLNKIINPPPKWANSIIMHVYFQHLSF